MTAPIKVDTHLHVYPSAQVGLQEKLAPIWEYAGKPRHTSEAAGTIDELLSQMQTAGITKGIVLIYTHARDERDKAVAELAAGLSDRERRERIAAIDASIRAAIERNNLWGCQISAQYPQLSAFITADPSVQSAEQAADHIRTMAEKHGAKGVKLHGAMQRLSLMDDGLWPLYDVCQELNLAVVAHGGPDLGRCCYCEPRAFIPVVKAFPKLRMIMAHMGGAAWRQTADVAAECPSLCFDLCEIIEWTGAPNAPTSEELARLIKAVGYQRVMMGSDFPWYDLDQTVKNVMELPLLTLAEKEAIMGANAVRLVNL